MPDPKVAIFHGLRMARTRGIWEDQVRELVRQHMEGRQFDILGEPRVNVLRLNPAFDHPP
ncbi:MAG: potassium-transporting ATPase subunit C [Nitrospinae bacterium]|nr:potassium-transporting ATPase subunit C [Nitrospinota bacterium]